MLRERAASVLDGVGAFRALLKVRSIAPSSFVTVLTYHRVAEPESIGELDPGVVDTRAAAFDAQLAFVRERCTPISIDQLREFVRGAPLPKNPVLVTFDDGYRDNHDVAFPLLKKHGIPGVFFVATSYVTERRLFWWDRASILLRRCRKESIEITYPTKRHVTLGTDEKSRARALKASLVPIKSHFGIELGRYMEELERATGVTLSRDEEKKLADDTIMTWEQVKAMSDGGMAIQSHTQTHRILGTLDQKALDEELRGAREVLEARVGKPVAALAYPVGKGLACAPEARRAIRRAGYELGFSNGTGQSNVLQFDPLDVRRLSLEVDLSDAYFRGMVAMPYFAYEPNHA